jgi:hypothetical protein
VPRPYDRWIRYNVRNQTVQRRTLHIRKCQRVYVHASVRLCVYIYACTHMHKEMLKYPYRVQDDQTYIFIVFLHNRL